ncbi:MAG TPA: hypothetical protein ENL13_01560 [Thermoplasmatales archaeon]|nr:hypothetical protein [Thermoplasmatales archaeon]
MGGIISVSGKPMSSRGYSDRVSQHDKPRRRSIGTKHSQMVLIGAVIISVTLITLSVVVVTLSNIGTTMSFEKSTSLLYEYNSVRTGFQRDLIHGINLLGYSHLPEVFNVAKEDFANLELRHGMYFDAELLDGPIYNNETSPHTISVRYNLYLSSGDSSINEMLDYVLVYIENY